MENFVPDSESPVKSWFDVQTTQMSRLILFVSAGVLYKGAFSLWVSWSNPEAYSEPCQTSKMEGFAKIACG